MQIIRKTQITSGHRVIMCMALCLFVLCQITAEDKQQQDDNRVYLNHADVLRYNRIINPDAQILDGNVAFAHRGATLYCDSAHFYEKTNSFEAFRNVRMYQGDTLSLFSDYAYYDGNEQMAMARENVVLKHRETTLYTDSLNYDRIYNVAYFFNGGRLVDKDSQLMSEWGEYNATTKKAVFNYNVVVQDEQFILKGDTLYYDTNTSWAHTVGPSNINSGTSHIYTEDGYFNTQTDSARLYNRSRLTDNGKVMVSDTLLYNSQRGVSEGFNDVVYVDGTTKNGLLCNYFWHDEQTGNGLARDSAVAIDFSQGDTLFMHADTFKIFTFNIKTDSVYRMVHAYNKVRAFRTDVQAVCDSLVFDSRDSCLTMYRDPIAWANGMQLLGEEIKVYMKDSALHHADVLRQALSVQQLSDSIHFNQVSSDQMTAHFENGDINRYDAENNVKLVYYPIEESDSTLIGLNYTETSVLNIYIKDRRMTKIWMPKAEGVMYPMSQIPPEKRYLPNYAWFDYVRPTDKDDIFHWRGKAAGTELKEEKRREAPLQYLNDNE